MKKSKLTEEDIINIWLRDYHNTSIDEVKEKHPEWTHNNKDYDSRDFYLSYPVTKEQHDEWYEKAISLIAKEQRLSKKYVKRAFVWTYLNVAPTIKEV